MLFLTAVGFKEDGSGSLVMRHASPSLEKSFEALQEASNVLEELRLAGLREKEEARKQEKKRREAALGRFKDRH